MRLLKLVRVIILINHNQFIEAVELMCAFTHSVDKFFVLLSGGTAAAVLSNF